MKTNAKPQKQQKPMKAVVADVAARFMEGRKLDLAALAQIGDLPCGKPLKKA